MTTGQLPWREITFPTHRDVRGSLTMAQAGPLGLVPFEIKRTYWLHDINPGEERGSHATFHTQQVLIPLAGACDVRVSDGLNWKTFELAHRPLRPDVTGILIGSGVWREVINFQPNTILLILSDTYYEDADYVRDWPSYIDRIRDGAPRGE